MNDQHPHHESGPENGSPKADRKGAKNEQRAPSANPETDDASENFSARKATPNRRKRDTRCGSATDSPGSMPAPLPTRKKPNQATSAAAHVSPEPAPDDPLLSFAPYRHKQPRANSITPERQRQFVSTLAATGVVSTAALSIGKSLEALYKLRARPGAEEFAAAWDAAVERGMARLKDIAVERAALGTPTPIVSGGRLLGTWDKPDNTLLRFLLQNRALQAGHGSASAVRLPRHRPWTKEENDEYNRREDELLASIDAKLALMRERGLTAKWRRRQAERAARAAALIAEMAEMVDAVAGGPVPSVPAGRMD